jgi:hypothetical protein
MTELSLVSETQAEEEDAKPTEPSKKTVLFGQTLARIVGKQNASLRGGDSEGFWGRLEAG